MINKNSKSSYQNDIYKSKYNKYKAKYLALKNQIEGGSRIFLSEEGLGLEEERQKSTFSDQGTRPILSEEGLEEKDSRGSKSIFPLGPELDIENTTVINNTQDTLLNNINQQFKLTNDKITKIFDKLNDLTALTGGGINEIGSFTQEDIDFITESNKKDHMNMINIINSNLDLNFKNLNENLDKVVQHVDDLAMCQR